MRTSPTASPRGPGRRAPEFTDAVDPPLTPITLEFPEDVFAALRRSPEEFGRELRLAAATHWYERGRISQETAARVAGLSRARFLRELARTKSDAFVVDVDDLKRELELG